jgi:hypothetical protein
VYLAGHGWVIWIDGTRSNTYFADSGYGPPVVATYDGVGTVGSAQCYQATMNGEAVDCGQTSGAQIVVITGANFGTVELGNSLDVRCVSTCLSVQSLLSLPRWYSSHVSSNRCLICGRYGPNGTELIADNCTIIKPHEQLQCLTAPGAGAHLKWTVVIDGLQSVSPTTSYAPPRITVRRLGTASTVLFLLLACVPDRLMCS